MQRPAETEDAPYFATYVSKVPETDVLAVLEAQPQTLRQLAAHVRADQEMFRYEPGKWSVREVFGHIVDVERVFGYRAAQWDRRGMANARGISVRAIPFIVAGHVRHHCLLLTERYGIHPID